MKGDSTCFAPITINNRKSVTNKKKAILLRGINCIPLDLHKLVNDIDNSIKIAMKLAITTSNLLGIDLKIA